MKKSKFSPTQIVKILNEFQERRTVLELICASAIPFTSSLGELLSVIKKD